MDGATFANRNLFCLYDCIQNGDADSLHRKLACFTGNINSVLPCKGVGILHLAVGIDPEQASVLCTQLMLKHGANPNLRSEDGMTPVHVAAIWGRLENLRLLVACGGDPGLQDDYGLTAFDYAQMEKQHEVLKYLQRNFQNQEDRSIEEEENEDKPSRYSLELDRILVSTGHVVAEYGAVSEDRLSSTSACRKSAMVRAWCEHSCRVNQLYPTILNQTYRIDELTPSHLNRENGDNVNGNQPLEETKTSYKTCLIQDDTHITGVEPLEITASEDLECDCSCHSELSVQSLPKRISLYENFSLPGSPTNVVHQNYNSKTSLRKNKSANTSQSKSIFRCKKKNSFKCKKKKEKKRNNDKQLNDALAEVQNDTNEWLSQSNSSVDSDHHLNGNDTSNDSLTREEISLIQADACTRRLSERSSGVNSMESSGSIALASVQEEFRYQDPDEEVVLIEKRLLVPSVVVAMDETASQDASPEQSRHSMASSLPASIDYDVKTLRAELAACGFSPGPITPATKRLYLRKLKNLKKNAITAMTPQGKTYSAELERSLRSESWLAELPACAELERAVRSDFAQGPRAWREGSAKTSFTYLLLDPRLTADLPAAAAAQAQHATWTTFVSSIFYVGKGKRSRPYSHLYQALTLWKRNFRTSNDKKIQHILDIWRSEVGVICLHVFQNTIPAEAYTYEAAMIDVIGVANLKNLKGGNYYGVAAKWSSKDRRMLGLYLLYKAMLIFLSEGERQLRPGDID